MNTALPPLLALVLVLSLPAMTVVAADGETQHDASGSVAEAGEPVSPIEIEETTNRLPLSDPVTNDYATSGPNLGATLAGSDSQLRVEHEQFAAIDREYDDASDEKRVELLEASYAAFEANLDDLEERERTAVREHADGDRSTEQLLQTFRQNYYEAETLFEVLATIDERADDVSGYTLSSDERRENQRLLETHQSPLKSDLVGGSESIGESDIAEYRVQTAEDSYRLSMIDESSYRSDTIRFENRAPDAPDRIADRNQTGFDRANELYPWAADRQTPTYTEAGSIHDAFFDADSFDLHVFIDAGTAESFYEYQRLPIDELPIAESWETEEDGLELSLRATPADGPVEVIVTDAETGDPESATVTIDDEVVGETDADGSLWYLPPVGEYELGVETETTEIDASIDIST